MPVNTTDFPILHTYDVYCNGRSLRGLLSACSWEENPGELAARATITIDLEDYVDQTVLTDLQLNKVVQIIVDESTVVFTGLVWEWDYDLSEPTQLTVIAYAPPFRLTKSKENYRFAAITGETTMATAALVQICTDWNIPAGTWDFVDVQLERSAYQNDRLADIVYDILEQVRFIGGNEVLARSNGLGLDIVPPGGNATVYMFTARNIDRMRGHYDMNDLVTRVKVYTGIPEVGEGDMSFEIIDGPGAAEYGIMQEVLDMKSIGELGDAQQAAQEIFALRGDPRHYQRIMAPDIPTIRKGDQHQFDVGPVQGLKTLGGVHHDATTGVMTMEIGTSEFRRTRRPTKPTIHIGDDPVFNPPGSTSEPGGATGVAPQPTSTTNT